MANADDLAALRDQLLAIPAENVKVPAIPIDVFLQETENMITWAQPDLQELIPLGITMDFLSGMGVGAGACRETQSLWMKEYRGKQEAQIDWLAESPLAYELRDELLHSFRFAYRNDAYLLSRVADIADGTGHADMIQDLNDLAVLGRSNPAPLTAIGFDLTKLDTAAQKAASLAELLALANGEREQGSAAKDLRDRAYTHLKEQADQLRAAGKYAFWKNPDRLKGYTSDYWKSKKKKSTETESSGD